MADVTVDVGKVRFIDGEDAWVELIDTKACDECAARVICKPGRDGSKQLKVWNPVNAKVGDTVQLEDRHNLMLKVGMFQFGFPLLGFLIGIFSIYFSKISLFSLPEELLMFCVGVVGIVLGGFLGRRLMQNIAETNEYFFKISYVMENPMN